MRRARWQLRIIYSFFSLFFSLSSSLYLIIFSFLPRSLLSGYKIKIWRLGGAQESFGEIDEICLFIYLLFSFSPWISSFLPRSSFVEIPLKGSFNIIRFQSSAQIIFLIGINEYIYIELGVETFVGRFRRRIETRCSSESRDFSGTVYYWWWRDAFALGNTLYQLVPVQGVDEEFDGN